MAARQRFLAGGHRAALQSYLTNILEGLSTSKSKKGAPAERDQKFAPQRTIICTWLVEMMLDRLDSLQSAATEHGGDAEERGARDGRGRGFRGQAAGEGEQRGAIQSQRERAARDRNGVQRGVKQRGNGG
jgi:hypothetical protein